LSRNPGVQEAYLSQIQIDLKGEKPQLFLVLKIDPVYREEFEKINEELSMAIRGKIPEGESITVQIYDGTGINWDIVKTVDPFYTRP